MKVYTPFIICFLIIFQVAAEFRIWESPDGDIWEAEFVTMKGQMVLLKDQAGTVKEYRREDLSENDNEYLDEMLPPTLSIDISKTTDGTGTGSTDKIICNLTLKQTDTRKYNGELTVVLLVLGEDTRTGSISVASRTEENVTISETWGKPIQISSRKTTLFKSSAKRGRVYGGYLAVVWDRFGNAIAIETNKAGMEDRAEKLAYVSLKNRKNVDL